MVPPSTCQIHQLSQAVGERANILPGEHNQLYLLSIHSAQVNCHDWTAVISINQSKTVHELLRNIKEQLFLSTNKHVHHKGRDLLSNSKA